MKKFAKIAALAVLACCVLALVFAFIGNPVSWVLVSLRAPQYLKDTYPELDLKIDSIVYDHLFGGFDADVISPTSRDTHFTLTLDGWGNVDYDRYNSVSSGANTAARLSREYQTLVQSALSDPESVFADSQVYAEFCISGNIEYNTFSEDGVIQTRTLEKDFSMDLSALELDKDYDLSLLGQKHGELKITVISEDVTAQQAAALLLALKLELDARGISFYAVEFTLCSADYSRELILWDFLYADIYEDGMVRRVEQSHQEYQDYWAADTP